MENLINSTNFWYNKVRVTGTISLKVQKQQVPQTLTLTKIFS